eukprot:5081572-Prymnesium_polylepis.1
MAEDACPGLLAMLVARSCVAFSRVRKDTTVSVGTVIRGWADEYVTFPRKRSPLAHSAMLCRDRTSR